MSPAPRPGIDLTLALIEEDYGLSTALTIARELVVYLKRSGGQEQYSEPLQFETLSTDRVAAELHFNDRDGHDWHGTLALAAVPSDAHQFVLRIATARNGLSE
jgi:transcriptional regulator GlxA family with amidase domain